VAILLGATIVSLRSVAALVAPLILGLLILGAVVRRLSPADDSTAYRRTLRWTMVALFSHLAFGVVVTNLSDTFAFFRSDGLTYHALAIDLLGYWGGDLPSPNISPGKEGFYYLLACLYWVLGAHTAAGLAVNAVMSAAIVPVVSDLTWRLFGREAAARAVPLMVLLPGVFIWTSQLLKEAAVLLLIAIAANAAVRMNERFGVGALAMGTGSMALLLTFRGPVGLVVAAGHVLGIAFGRRQVVAGISTGLSALGLIAVLVLALGLGYSGLQSAAGSDLAQANLVRQDLAQSANTGFGTDADISTAKGALSYLPSGLLSFGLGPFPWQLQGLGQLSMVPDVLVWWYLLPHLWRGLRSGARMVGRRILVLVFPAMLTTVLLALVVSNFGTVVRERGQVVVLLVPFIALGLAQRGAASTGHGYRPEAEFSSLNKV